MKEHYDVIIVGTGAAGLYCALNLPEKMKILLITKQEADQSDSFLAQGGICMLRGWEKSAGAVAEYALAKKIGLEIITECQEAVQ